MNENEIRPVPSSVRWAALLTLLASTVLLLLGGLTTTFGAGMSDRQWPTSPTHLADNPEILQGDNTGLKIEHLHRVFGFITGALASILAILAWRYEPSKLLRTLGLIAVVTLIVIYGQFHREMGTAWHARLAGSEMAWPKTTGIITLGFAVALLGVGVAAMRQRQRGWSVRLWASVALIAVMVQGLLGGFRVFLDQLMGTQLAAIHGTFAQIVFCLLTVVVVLTAVRRPGDIISEEDRKRIGTLALIIPIALVVQLIWGVWLRHVGSPVAQRLHILTAFVITGLMLWMSAKAVGTESGRKKLGFLTYHLLSIVALQILLGVESWMAKFAASGPQATILPQFRTVTRDSAGIRTAHVLIGTALLAASVVYAMRVWRTAPGGVEPAGEKEDNRAGVPSV